VVPERKEKSPRESGAEQECDSRTWSSDSDSEEMWSLPMEKEPLTLRETDLAWVMTGTFPQNPEMATAAWAIDQDPGTSWQEPLLPANLAATMTPIDADQGRALPLLYVTEVPEAVRTLADQESGQMPWHETNEDLLRRELAKPFRGLLGCRCCDYLGRWRQTCGGNEMMNIGMWTYWTDPVESPRRLWEENKMREHHLDDEQRAAFLKLLQEELDQGILTRIAWADTGYVSPSFVVKKRPGPDGKVKWRNHLRGQPSASAPGHAAVPVLRVRRAMLRIQGDAL
jgi:hypothetical protein